MPELWPDHRWPIMSHCDCWCTGTKRHKNRQMSFTIEQKCCKALGVLGDSSGFLVFMVVTAAVNLKSGHRVTSKDIPHGPRLERHPYGCGSKPFLFNLKIAGICHGCSSPHSSTIHLLFYLLFIWQHRFWMVLTRSKDFKRHPKQRSPTAHETEPGRWLFPTSQSNAVSWPRKSMAQPFKVRHETWCFFCISCNINV